MEIMATTVIQTTIFSPTDFLLRFLFFAILWVIKIRVRLIFWRG